METQLKKLLEDYKEKGIILKNNIDQRERQGLECNAHYSLLNDYSSAIEALEFLLDFMAKE